MQHLFLRQLRNKLFFLSFISMLSRNFFLFIKHPRRIQSQHNLLEKELAEHTIDILKYSNIRIIEKVSQLEQLKVMP